MGQSPSKPVILGSVALGVAGLLAVGALCRSKADDGEKRGGKEGELLEFYNVDSKKIGEGTYGSVSKCTKKSTGELRAVKSLSKAQGKNISLVQDEIANLKVMDHPNIIHLYETYEDHRNIYLVMEICTGGDLFQKIGDMDVLTEVQAAMAMEQILHGVSYIHKKGIIHRLLQPEHCLFQTSEPIEANTLKIIDFAFSRNVAEDEILTTKCGTPFYVAPQVLAGKYDQLADMWSCGVIMYILICGYPPFHAATEAETVTKVRLANYSFLAADWNKCGVSEDAKHLVRMLLKLNPRDRYSADQALSHVWIKNKPQTCPLNTVKNLKNFQSWGEGSRTRNDLSTIQ